MFKNLKYDNVDPSRYIIYTDCRIYDKFKRRFINSYKHTNGYIRYDLRSCDKKRIRVYEHRAMMLNFKLFRKLNKMIINHIDGDKGNNNISNLEWVDYSDNLDHAYKNNLRKSNRVYSEELVSSIYKLILDDTHYTPTNILGIGYTKKIKSLIFRIKNKNGWSDILI